MSKKTALSVAAALTLTGCASLPSGQISYLFPKAATQFAVTQTITCNEQNKLIEVVAVTPTTSYFGDTTAVSKPVVLSAFAGTLRDSDVTLTFTDDGRLSGVNTSSTGQGTELVKDVLAVAKAAGIALASTPGAMFNEASACKNIATYGSKKDKDGPSVITLTYTGTVRYHGNNGDVGLVDGDGKAVSSVELNPDVTSASTLGIFRHDIPNLSFTVQLIDSQKVPAGTWSGASDSDIRIQLNAVAIANLKIIGSVGNLQNVGTVWTGQIPVPLTDDNDRYWLPIPTASLFGTKKFSLTLSDYGSIQKVQYSAASSSDAFDAASSLGSALAGTLTKSQPAASAQDKSDEIYQQNRLAICLANASACPKQ